MFILNQGEYTGEIIEKRALSEGIVSTAKYTPESCNREWHSHENLHLSYVFQGGGESQSNTRAKMSLNTRFSDIYLYRAGEKHRWLPRPGVSKSINIELRPAFFENLIFDETRFESALERNIEIKFLMLKLQKEMLFADRESPETIRSLLYELGSSFSVKDTYKPPRWVGIAAEVLNDHWDKSVSLDELSVATGIHPVTISKYFRKHFFCTLGEYLRKLKIDRSLPLVKDSKKSLTEIAMTCGFSDQSHFTRTFKNVTGFLPKDFRKI